MKAFAIPAFSLFFGLVFGAGLVLSGMIDTANVKGFLDVAGTWRPALAFVMGGAVLVALPLFQWMKRHGKSLTGDDLDTPPQVIDVRLVLGAAIFGIGWGLSGICPGPGIVWLGIKPLEVAPFILAVIAGSLLADLFRPKT
ncbi:MAG: DUF6691 family protein [Asticcacaulis sp.]